MKPQPFGRYLLLDKVASGGMAEVWRAKLVGEGGFQRIIAIKKILPHVSEDQEFITMFQDEANITVQLQHSNIGQVYEFSRIEDIFYISMEYISGKDLKTVWSYQRSRKATLPLELACYCVQQMADGLDYAHKKRDNFGNELGIVHRDVSPQNCLLSWDGEVKVIDFGIAKAADKSGRTRAGTLKGKFAYMAPEQIRGLPLDGRADVFALGVCLYELVTGERGFQAESEFSLLEMVRNVEIKPPTMINADIPAELERIVFKALAKDREHRYQAASDLSEDLQRFLLNRGKPPNRQTMGQFLRENFTVDYDKERLRLESYKEIEWTPPAQNSGANQAAPGPQEPPPPPPPSPSELAVQAAMAADGTGAGAVDSTFASTTGVGQQTGTGTFAPGQQTGIGQQTGTGYSIPPEQLRENTAATPTGIRPAGNPQATLTGVAMPDATQLGQAPPGGSLGKKLAIAAVVFLFLAIAGGTAGFFLLRGSATIVVQVTNTDTATVRLDGEIMGEANPSITLSSVSTGTHNLIIEKPGFEVFHRTVHVESGKLLPLKAELTRANGRLNIMSEPAGAQIFLNGKKTDKVTPATIAVPGGTSQKVTLKLPDFREASKSQVRVDSGKEEVVELKLKPERVTIKVVSSPTGANVKLDGNVVGQTPTEFKVNADAAYPRVLVYKRGCRTESTIPFDRDKAEYRFEVSLRGCR